MNGNGGTYSLTGWEGEASKQQPLFRVTIRECRAEEDGSERRDKWREP